MLNSWFESVFLKRIVLALAAGASAHAVAFIASPLAVQGLTHLQAIGISATVVIDQAKLANFLTVSLFALSQGAHEWAAAKYPEFAKFL